MFNNVYTGKKVLVTGNTGFKGSWLTIWLLKLGAKVGGISNNIPTIPSNYELSGLNSKLKQYFIDITDYKSFENSINDFSPDIIFHMAAQALVRKSIRYPRLTFESNTIGTLNLLEILRDKKSSTPTVIITSDKCYKNVEWIWGYRENDELGGDDPYSASKAAAEIVFRSYINTYQNIVAVTTRAGNVIGGGDWAEDRLIPDCMKAWLKGENPFIRKPEATRPWQHVLEPLSGYLWLGSLLFDDHNHYRGQSYNFGPKAVRSYSVVDILKEMKKNWEEISWTSNKEFLTSKNESKFLSLSCEKALHELYWEGVLNMEETAKMTIEWYRKFYIGEDMFEFTNKQILYYIEMARKQKLVWAEDEK